MITLRTRSTVLVIAAGASSACVPEHERCDPDQRYWYGLCYEIDAAVSHEAGPDASYQHFDDVCSGDSDCVAPTGVCAGYPGDPTGHCTRTGCLVDMSLCPGGWGCLDPSVYLPALPAICTRP